MNCPLISVIIPNYNHSKFLEERIQSVLNQTFQDFELILLDDCSPDNGASKAIFEKFRSNEHVSHIVYNEHNSGSTFKQWHKGFELAKGNLIWIAESDDSCRDNLLESLVAEFKRNEKCVLAWCYSQMINQNGEKYGNIIPDSDKITRLNGSSFVRRYMTVRNVVDNASAALFKKSVAQRLDKTYMEYTGAGDSLFWILLSREGDVSIIHAPLNLYRRHEGVVTSNKFRDGTNYREEYRTLQYMLEHKFISKPRGKLVEWRNRRLINNTEFIDAKTAKDIKQLWGCNQNPFPELIARGFNLMARLLGWYI